MQLQLDQPIELFSRTILQLPCEFYTTIICYRNVLSNKLKIDCLFYDSSTETIKVCVSADIISGVPCNPDYNTPVLEQVALLMHDEKATYQRVGANIFFQMTEYYRKLKS
jgi:hypothetical protein